MVTAVSEQCFRIRIQKEGDPESALNHYSIIQEPAVTFPLKVEEAADALILTTGNAKLHFQKKDGSLMLFDASGKVCLLYTSISSSRALLSASNSSAILFNSFSSLALLAISVMLILGRLAFDEISFACGYMYFNWQALYMWAHIY